MNYVADFGKYLWKFFVGDAFQLIGLAVAFLLVGLLAKPLGGLDGLLAFVLVMAVICIDATRRAAAQAKKA